MDDDLLDLNFIGDADEQNSNDKKLLESLQKPSEKAIEAENIIKEEENTHTNPNSFLPKTYNGKTVTDLFPEFRHDSVLRFSKLFGVGRQTSLPKIWKGTRRRKKQKQQLGEANSFNLNRHLSFNDENSELAKLVDNQPSNLSQNLMAERLTSVYQNLDRPDRVKDSENDKEMAVDEEFYDLEFEIDDEVDFLKPYLINDFEEAKNQSKSENENATDTQKHIETWLNGPAAYWYNLFNYDSLIESKKKELRLKLRKQKSKLNKSKQLQQQQKHSTDDEEEELEESQETDDATRDVTPNKIVKRENSLLGQTLNDEISLTQLQNDNETIDLTKTVINKLKSLIVEEQFLPINTTNWEDEIIIDLNQAAQQNSANSRMISERIKCAGWIPSSEHRTLLSFQTKVLGKRLENINQYKELNSQTSSSSFGRHSSNLNKEKEKPINWQSIFPSTNVDLFDTDWEQKIIIDPENIDVIDMKPPDFVIDPNDENLILSAPNDLFTLQEDPKFMKEQAEKEKKMQKEASQIDSKESSKSSSKKSLLVKSLSAKDDLVNDNEANNNDEEQTNNEQHKELKSFWNISNDEYYTPKGVVGDAQNNNSAFISSTQTPANAALQQHQSGKANVSTTLLLNHAQEALDLNTQLFPTHMSIQKLRNFHRFALKRALHGILAHEITFNQVHSMLKKFQKHDKLSLQFFSQKSQNNTSPEPGSIKYARDLSATDNCEIILAEYSEQFPPLQMQIGMSAKIRNYYKKKYAKDEGPSASNALEYGDLHFINQPPFLGALKPGEYLQSIESHMFRAPIYLHKVAQHDFLVVKSRMGGFLIRGNVRTVFTVGQECPLIEVPAPNSKRANAFLKDFLQVHISRLFYESQEVPRRIKLEDVKKAFPTLSDTSIKKRLKLCADPKRGAKNDSGNWWVLRDDIRLPSEEEIRQLVTPEQCCAYYSMLAAEQRLRDAGYGDKYLYSNDDDEQQASNLDKLEDEIKNAPWYTTRAYLDASKGKSTLQIFNRAADPTGCGEGFSYIKQAAPNEKETREMKKERKLQQQMEKERMLNSMLDLDGSMGINSPQTVPSMMSDSAKKTVTGTDADLRRLHLSQARELLMQYGVPESEIKKLKRWEIIDVVRTLSTQKAKEGDGAAVSKFARGGAGATKSTTQTDEKYKEECQRLFELQNRILASEDYLSTEEEDDDDDLADEMMDSDVDELGKDLESMLQDKMKRDQSSNNIQTNSTNNNQPSTSSTANSTKETKSGRKKGEKNEIDNEPLNDIQAELRTLIMSQTQKEDQSENVQQTQATNAEQNIKYRIMKITRTFVDEETGQEYTKIEIVKKPVLIDLYTNIRTQKDDHFIRRAFNLDDIEKEKLRREKKRLQEQLRKVKQLDQNGERKVRKYNKTGLNRKANKLAKLNDESVLNSSPDSSNLATLQKFKSYDENSNTLTGATPQVVTKRKYVKRKKPNSESNNGQNEPQAHSNQSQQATGGAVSTGELTKLEGTKLIIKKKAISMAQNDSDFQSPQKKKYKKHSSMTSELLGVNMTSVQNDEQQKITPKLKIVIAKEKLATSSTNLVEMSAPSSPHIDVTSVTGTNTAVNLSQSAQTGTQKRAYNKQNSSSNVKKQQQQQQLMQQQLQLQQQISEDPMVAAMAAAAASMQFANFLAADPNQLLLQLQQQLTAPTATNTSALNFPPNAPLNAMNSVFGNSNNNTNNNKQTAANSNLNQSGQLKARKSSSNMNYDYLVKPQKKVDRRHTDPLVTLQILLENILNELRELPEAQPFLTAVSLKKVPDYFNIVKNPIDLSLIRKKIQDKHYKNRQTFLDDIKLLVDNSVLYNGPVNYISQSAQKLHFLCKQRIEEKKEQLARLEKAINPLLDDNSLIVLNYLLDKIFEKHIMTVENSFAFLKPVNKTKYRDYYEIVKRPIDLEQIKQKITTKKYRSKAQFIEDFELLYNNCLIYNGPNNSYTFTAERLLNACKDGCENSEWSEQLQQIEDQIECAMQEQYNQDTNSNSAAPEPSNVFANNHQVISISSKPKPKKTGQNPTLSKKTNPFGSLMMRNSPKSSSDAEVYVDVESVDDKALNMPAELLASGNSTNVHQGEAQSDQVQEEGEILIDNVDEVMYDEDVF